MLGFSADEYARRRAVVRERMAAAEVDALVMSSPEAIYYLTGYDAWSWYVPQAAVLGMDGDVRLVLRAMDAMCAELGEPARSGTIAHSYEDDRVDATDPARHPYALAGEVAAALAPPRGVVGGELAHYFFTPRCAAAVQAAIGDRRLVDASGAVNWARSIKSDEEIACIRLAGRLASQAMGAAHEVVRPGVRECDAIAEISRCLIAGIDGEPGTMTKPPHIATAPYTSAPHLSWSARPFPDGGTVNLELGGCIRHYFAGLARTLPLGPVDDDVARLGDIVSECMDAALDTVRAGRTCEEVERAWREALAAHGLRKDSRIGYSIGIGFQPTWLEHTMSLRQGDLTVLETNMTFHMICGMWEGETQMETSESFRVTADGAEILTDFPRNPAWAPAVAA